MCLFCVSSHPRPDEGTIRVKRFVDADLMSTKAKPFYSQWVEAAWLPGFLTLQCFFTRYFATHILCDKSNISSQISITPNISLKTFIKSKEMIVYYFHLLLCVMFGWGLMWAGCLILLFFCPLIRVCLPPVAIVESTSVITFTKSHVKNCCWQIHYSCFSRVHKKRFF